MNRRVASIFLSCVVSVLALTSAGFAQNLTNLPMIGLTQGETLQVHLLAYPPSPCSAVMGFQDSNGNVIGNTKTVNLQAGESAEIAINGNSLTSEKDDRVEVLPTIVVNGGDSPSACVASAEVFANVSGIANVLVPGTVGFPPAPVFGMVGVTSVETVRLNVVAFPPSPCAGTLSFVNNDGTPVGGTLNVQLSDGQAAFLDLPGNAVVAKAGQRAVVHPVVSVTSSDACIASAEVYLNSTEATAVFFPPNPCGPNSTSCIGF